MWITNGAQRENNKQQQIKKRIFPFIWNAKIYYPRGAGSTVGRMGGWMFFFFFRFVKNARTVHLDVSFSNNSSPFQAFSLFSSRTLFCRTNKFIKVPFLCCMDLFWREHPHLIVLCEHLAISIGEGHGTCARQVPHPPPLSLPLTLSFLLCCNGL